MTTGDWALAICFGGHVILYGLGDVLVTLFDNDDSDRALFRRYLVHVIFLIAICGSVLVDIRRQTRPQPQSPPATAEKSQ